MKIRYIFLFCLFFFNAYAQTIQQIDSVTLEMCTTLKGLTVHDSLKIRAVYEKHMPSFSKIITVSSEKAAAELGDRLYFRLQKNCEAFSDLLNTLEAGKGDWGRLAQKPISSLSPKDCQLFGEGKKYYYKEYNGAIVNVEIANGIWRETFSDNTVSALNFLPGADCEFALEFIRSDNGMRKNLSVKGDTYQYGLFEKKKGIYSVWVQGAGAAVDTFKLYPLK
ncbi:MAG TPA: hypothetical protein VF676_01285 [Flavobacterium sp.]|jgi:hypothetical protein